MKRLVVVTVLFLSLILLSACGSRGVYDLPKDYSTKILVGQSAIGDDVAYVKDYTITNGVLTFSDYYMNYYSCAPRNHYFVYYQHKVITSMFSIIPEYTPTYEDHNR